MTNKPIDAAQVKRTLKSLSTGQIDAKDPLTALACVSLRVRASGNRIGRAQALAELIQAIVYANLLDCRRIERADATVDQNAPLDACLRADFAAGNAERESWSALFHYDLSPAGRLADEVADSASTSRNTFDRRRGKGRVLLTDEINRREAVAARQLQALEPERLPLETYRRDCLERWQQPRYQLDLRFVRLSLLIDHGEELGWRQDDRQFDSLGELLKSIDDNALVVLGAPGSGKSTLLRQLEMDTAARGLAGDEVPITLFVPLNSYRSTRPGADPPDPRSWLTALWAERHPDLPPLERLFAQRRMLLLLDALNEMPHDYPDTYHQRVRAWRSFIQQLHLHHPGNTIVISCRSLDYSAPLSSETLRVPQARIEAMDEHRMRAFLDSHLRADIAARVWSDLIADRSRLGALRTPYMLKLLVEQIIETGTAPRGSVGLFAGFVRNALKRELETENPLLEDEDLVPERDRRRILTATHWKTPWELPSAGSLLSTIAHLAFSMQRVHGSATGSQVRIGYDEATAIVGRVKSPRVLDAGMSLGVLELDAGSDELHFYHQLLQEFFAARQFAITPEPAEVATSWRADEVQPSLEETLASLAPAETLPSLPTTGWEETTIMATVMTPDAESLVRRIMHVNLSLAGLCAAHPEAHISELLRTELQCALVDRSRDALADLRCRIAAADALGLLGDPRLVKLVGRHGSYIKPPMVEIPPGRYQVLASDSEITSPEPNLSVRLERFQIGMFPVTCAEWACFMESGSYEDPQWWDTPEAREWWSGHGTGEGGRERERTWRKRFQADPTLLERQWSEGLALERVYSRWKRWMRLNDLEFEEELARYAPDKKIRSPEYWNVDEFNHPLQPVVGITWFEAQAYCRWLSIQDGRAYRLPTEIEWEVAGHLNSLADPAPASPPAGSIGGSWTHLRRPSPIGVFPLGDSAAGAVDMLGNVRQWVQRTHLRNVNAPSFTTQQCLRGSTWALPDTSQHIYLRHTVHASSRFSDAGLRLCHSVPD